jgi:hypothetical protein
VIPDSTEYGALVLLTIIKLILDGDDKGAYSTARGDNKKVSRADLDAALYLLYSEYQQNESIRHPFHMSLNYLDYDCKPTNDSAFQIVEAREEITTHLRGSKDCEARLLGALLVGIMEKPKEFEKFTQGLAELAKKATPR